MVHSTVMTHRERFIAAMDYGVVDRVPNHEVGVWPQTMERWIQEELNPNLVNWDWWVGDDFFQLDPRDYFDVDLDMQPCFEHKMLEKTDRYEIFQDQKGITHKALLEGTLSGTRTCMDQYLRFPVENREDFHALKKRYIMNIETRYPKDWEKKISSQKRVEHPLVLGKNCSTLGFYWRAREWMGTENLSYAWYDLPELMHEMMEFIADFTIAVCKPVLEKSTMDYVMINEDMAMKGGPLLSPDCYKTFIFPHMKRIVDFFKNHGVRYVVVDTDGDSELLLKPLMDAGVDAVWPLERASNMDPVRLRKTFGRELRLWGGVDKREIAKGSFAIEQHLKALAPLVEEGGFIPTVDHMVPPDISLDNFQYYMNRKRDLLRGLF